MEDPKKQLNKYLRFSGVAIQMGAVIGLSAWLGVWLDGKYNPKGNMYTLICTLTGVFVGMYLVIKEVINMSKDDN